MFNPNAVYEDADEALVSIIKQLQESGDRVGTRQEEMSLELIHKTFSIALPLHREILNPERKASLVAQVAETAWVLSGRADVEWLSHYLPRAKDFSDNGKTWRGAYGPRLRTWGVTDQVEYVVNLLKKDPDTRRAVISLYDAGIDSKPGKDIPCNNWLHFLKRGNKLFLSVAIRSNDVIWGWSGINQFEWSVLLEIVAKLVGCEVGAITYFVGSQHIYEKHFGRMTKIISAELKTRRPNPQVAEPRFAPTENTIEYLDNLWERFFALEGKIRTGVYSSGGEDDVRNFPEPMLRSWLCLLASYWTGSPEWLEGYRGTRFYAGWEASVKQYAKKTTPELMTALEAFEAGVNALHERKHKAYGDSWRRRGEILGIMANIARKVDRLGKTTDDETAADTAIDLMNYLVKYHGWIGNFGGRGEVEDFRARLHEQLAWMTMPHPYFELAAENRLREKFEKLETALGLSCSARDDARRNEIVSAMLADATRYAVHMWWGEQRRRLLRGGESELNEDLQIAAERVAAWRPDIRG
jgi:thymidylate synthase